MKTHTIIGTALMLLIVSSCGSAMKNIWTREGYTGKHYNKILVLGAVRNLDSRTVFESTVVKLLASQGITAENSLKTIPPIEDINQISKDKIIKAVEEGNYDGVIVASLLDITTKDAREGGSPIHGSINNGMGYYGFGYGSYIYSNYNTMYTPDYYRQVQNYVVETRLFDAKAASVEKAMVWSAESKITSPRSFEMAAESYANTVVK
ncbi:MAG: hypothetical protein E4H26_01795, partial [Flavobacteriales bacterium]